MVKFAAVIKSLREWLLSFSFVKALMPFSLYLLIGGLGLRLLTDIFVLFNFSFYWSISSVLGFIIYVSWWLGFWLCLLSPNIKYVPYAIFGDAFVTLFPFKYIGLASAGKAAIWVFLGFWLLRFTALQGHLEQTSE